MRLSDFFSAADLLLEISYMPYKKLQYINEEKDDSYLLFAVSE